MYWTLPLTKEKKKTGARLIPYLGALAALYYCQKSKLEKVQ